MSRLLHSIKNIAISGIALVVLLIPVFAFTEPVIADITSPINYSVTQDTAVNIIGTASGTDFTGYTLIMSHNGQSQELVNVTTPVENGILGTVNIPAQEEGVYQINLSVYGYNMAVAQRNIVFSKGRTQFTAVYNEAASPTPALYGVCTGKDGKIYLADIGNNRITVLNPDGSFFKVIGEGEVIKPYGIALDDNDNVYAPSGTTIRVYDKEGNFQRSITDSRMANIQGVTVKENKLYVAEYNNHEVLVFDLFGNFLFAFGKDNLVGALDVAIDDEGRAYVGNGYGAYNVVVFDLRDNNKYLYSFGNFNIPTDVELDKNGLLYIVDFSSNSILVYHKEGIYIGTAIAPGQIYYPYKFHIGADGYLYTTEYYNYRIQKFKVNYTCPLAELTSPADYSLVQNSISITGIAAGPDFLSYKLEYARFGQWQDIGTYTTPVTDGVLGTLTLPENEEGIYQLKLTVKDKYGVEISRTTFFAKGRIQLLNKADAAVSSDDMVEDNSGNLWVSETNNARIAIYDHDLHLIKYAGTGILSGYTLGLARDATGNIYVCDGGSKSIMVFDPTGNSSGSFGSGQLTSPYAITIDSSGYIYVVNRSESNVMVFDQNRNYLYTFAQGYAGYDIAVKGTKAYVVNGSTNVYVFDISKNGQYLYAYTNDNYSRGLIGIEKGPDGLLYVNIGYYVKVFSEDLGPLYQIGIDSPGNAPGSFQYTYRTHVLNDGLYIIDYSGGNIQKFKLSVSCPQASITNPATYSSVSSLISITGTAASPDFASYKLEYARFGQWQEIGTYTTAVQNGILGTLILPETEEGMYELRLTVTDTYGAVNIKTSIFSKGRSRLEALYTGAGSQFSSLIGICTGKDGKMYLADRGYNRITVLNSDGTFYKAIGQGDISYPYGIAVDESDNIYVCSGNTNVRVYDKEGNFLRSITHPKITNVQGVTVKNSKLYVAEYGNHEILIFDLLGNYLDEFGKDNLIGAYDVAIDDNGRAFVGNGYYSYNVVVFDLNDNNKYLYSFGSFNVPTDIEIGKDGLLYIADYNYSAIRVYHKEGFSVGTAVGPGVDLGQIGSPYKIHIDADGYLYTTEYYNNRIQKFEVNYTYPEAAITSPVDYASAQDSVAITGTASGADFDSYKLEYAKNDQWQEIGTYTTPVVNGSLGTLNLPTDENAVYQLKLTVKNKSGVERVKTVTFSKGKLQYLGKMDSYTGSQYGQLNSLYGICLGNNGHLYVCEGANNRVVEMDQAGNFIRYIGQSELNHPVGINKDALGNIYVGNYNSSEVCVYNQDGIFLRRFGTSILINPGGLLIKNDKVYVTSHSNSKIAVFDLNGNHLGEFGNGYATYPYDIAISNDNKAYVACYNNVAVFDLNEDNKYLFSFGPFNYATSIKIDNNGYVYVSNYYNYSVDIYTQEGILVCSLGTSGSGPGQFGGTGYGVFGMFIDNNILYTTEYSTHRIQKFKSLYEVTPKISSVSLSKQSPVNVGALTVSLVFDRPMNTAASPNVYYKVIGKSTLYPIIQKSYVNTVWTGEVNIETSSDNGDACIVISGAKDAANNIEMFLESSHLFVVDTAVPQKPSLVSPNQASIISSGEFTIKAEGDTDLAYMSCEKSVDGSNWQEIARVNGSGVKDYAYSWNPLPNEIYLRLKAVDAANNYTYSDVLTGYTLDFSATGNVILTGPVKNSKVGKIYPATAYCNDPNITGVRFEKSSDSTDGWDGTWIPLEGSAENSSDFSRENDIYSVSWLPLEESFKYIRLVVMKNDDTTIVTQGSSGFIYDLNSPVAPVSAKNALVNNNLNIQDGFIFRKNNVIVVRAEAGKDNPNAYDRTFSKVRVEYSLAGENNWILIGEDSDSSDWDYQIPWDTGSLAENTVVDIKLTAFDEVENASALIYRNCHFDFSSPAQPVNFSVTSRKGGYVDLTWQAP
ncbi:MAG: NHL repeat-containing protein, partial [Dehalococcoidales bacterium]|nr:NHL repeat-containing protein [Dehalococcoidales bacterium]